MSQDTISFLVFAGFAWALWGLIVLSYIAEYLKEIRNLLRERRWLR
jgi:hypothetical protein